MAASIRVLIVEDHPEDAELMARLLKEDGFKFKWQRVETEPAYLDALETQPDLILADWTLPQFSGQRALQLMQERDLDIPFIIVSGTIGEEPAVAAMREGAYDYVLKDRPARLGQAVRRALDQKKLRQRRRKSERALRQSEERFRIITENIGDMVWLADMNLKTIYISPSVVRARGFTLEELQARPVQDNLTPASWQTALKAMAEELSQEKLSQTDLRIERTLELEYYRKDGSTFWSETTMALIRGRGGEPTGIVGVDRDITERKRAEDELRESEERFREMAELLPIAIAEADLDQHITYLNRRGLEMFGRSLEDVKSTASFLQYVIPEELERASAHFNRMFSGKPVEPFEIKLLRADGSVFDALFAVALIKRGDQLVGTRAAWQDITDRKRAEDELRRQTELMQTILDNVPIMISYRGVDGRHRWLNRCWQKTLGWSQEEAQSRDIMAELYPDPEYRRQVFDFIREANGHWGDFEIRTRNGTLLHTTWANVTLSTGANIGIGQDITERKRAEEEREKLQAQFIQAQKMESVGRLAGGVAHDFNNMLQTIIGRCELAFEETAADSPQREDLLEIQKAANRSADLTRQLLAFARKQTVAPQVLDLNDTVEGMLKMLRRLIGEDIDLFWKPGLELWPVRLDPSQIDQIMANLSVNARDAIVGTGKVTIETENVSLDEAYCAAHAGFAPGEYVLLAVSDDGSGMDRETLEHIFEPFFTTKEEGEGTGLGLATVYGIVRQNEGFINVYSEPGKGTTFRIYLRRFEGKAVEAPAGFAEEAPRGHGETVLLVEDEKSILNVGRKMLERLGYAVLTANAPSEALRQVEEHGGEIHLLITDVVMPEMNGRELAERIVSIQPNLKCLFMSGYTANAIAHRGVLNEGVRFVQKPFSLQGLAAKVREALDD